MQTNGGTPLQGYSSYTGNDGTKCAIFGTFTGLNAPKGWKVVPGNGGKGLTSAGSELGWTCSKRITGRENARTRDWFIDFYAYVPQLVLCAGVGGWCVCVGGHAFYDMPLPVFFLCLFMSALRALLNAVACLTCLNGTTLMQAFVQTLRGGRSDLENFG